jgi:hypothetical protein
MPSKDVWKKFKRGTLRSGSKHGPKVKSRAQATAIFLSERRKEQAHGGKYPHKRKKRRGRPRHPANK